MELIYNISRVLGDDLKQYQRHRLAWRTTASHARPYCKHCGVVPSSELVEGTT